ncbi:(2Fe-2S)-binding protein [Cohnella herbarum]|uniref:(2Fe-2S)-binding protein n=1 Tax=Cohnella herbarum TaxID=2728023 RepID=A0A7Z2ZQ38_9BACL|nr:(2Fe-2S)-binding protein [Cohnella herbarum]QJD87814.1 (2Fe-2S)-binding protein [Cohnella herbarum]
MNDPDIVVCRCEEVTLSQIADTLKRYECSSRETKLRTRAGMGICGGRTCRPLIELLVSEAGGSEFDASAPLKVQQPVRPITFGNWGANQ